MADFREIKKALIESQQDSSKAKNALGSLSHELKELLAQKRRLQRSKKSDDQIFIGLLEKEQELQESLQSAKTRLSDTLLAQNSEWRRFEALSDPRVHIKEHSDDFPILLAPVRIETRFKREGNDGGRIHQLWIRIFPDECSIDTFEENLTSNEVKRAQQYWMTIWSGGESGTFSKVIDQKKKAAWKALSSNMQPGRAYWITETYRPVNIDEIPTRSSDEEIILVIPTFEELTDEVVVPLQEYWKQIFLANGSLEAANNALQSLSTTIGSEEEAIKYINQSKPYNLDHYKITDSDNTPSVEVSFIAFPQDQDFDERNTAWTNPIRVKSFPERFVVLGYKNGSQVINELGNLIPSPLILGPDPSLDTNSLLAESMLNDYLNLPTQEEKDTLLRQYHSDLKEDKKISTPDDFISEIIAASHDNLLAKFGQILTETKDEINAAKYIKYLCSRSETKWLYDFDEAVRLGMGFKIDLNPREFNEGFDQLFVLGVKLSADANEGQEQLEELLRHHHFGSSGLSFLKQGTPTNNTEDTDSGFTAHQDPDRSYRQYFEKKEPSFHNDCFKKTDGQWFVEILGIDPHLSSLIKSEHFDGTDICEAKAMNIALWDATWGYYLESLMHPIFSDWSISIAREYYTKFVSGRGNIPVLRIGQQPYGIIPTNHFGKSSWFNQDDQWPMENWADKQPIIKKLFLLLQKINNDWQNSADKVALVSGGNIPYEGLMQALGLHASSIEFDQRYAYSSSFLFNYLFLLGRLPSHFDYFQHGQHFKNTAQFVRETFRSVDEHPPGFRYHQIAMLQLLNNFHTNHIKGSLIEDSPLSDDRSLEDDYIHWLLEKAHANFGEVLDQNYIKADTPPILFQMLKQSFIIQFANIAYELLVDNGKLSDQQVVKGKIISHFYNMPGHRPEHGRQQVLRRSDPEVTGSSEISLAQHISKIIASGSYDGEIREFLTAVEKIAILPTAHLERIYAEHLDCSSHRLDAWINGFVNLQLQGMRDIGYDDNRSSKQGIYLGAWGYVENLKPDDTKLSEITIDDADLDKIFNPEGALKIYSDSSNAGYIHAPSINQAITAAVLRNAHIATADEENQELYKVNLSSERVRMALSLIEGIQHGQGLGELLGYQLERGLHDHNELELDEYIYELRKVFPLVAENTSTTEVDDDSEFDEAQSITKIEARNVIDGLKLVNHIAKNESAKYPFGFALGTGRLRLKNPGSGTDGQAIKAAIDTEVQRILNINDALSDLVTAEGVHQVVQGNYERAAGILQAFNRGGFPQIPDVIKTPRSGTVLTHRVGLHLNPDSVAANGANPHAIAEPAIQEFLDAILPDLSSVKVSTSYTTHDQLDSHVTEIAISQLGLSAMDLMYMLNVETDKALTFLDSYIIDHLHQGGSLRPDTEIKIQYTKKIDNGFSLFQLTPLIKSIRSIVLASRSLNNTDLQLSNEASRNNIMLEMDETKLENVLDKLKENFTNGNWASNLKMANEDSHIINLYSAEQSDAMSFAEHITKEGNAHLLAEIVDNIDDFISVFLAECKLLSLYGFEGAGFGFIYDRKANIFNAIYQKVDDYRKRWEDKLMKFDELFSSLEDPVNELTDSQKIEILQKAERTISTAYSIPIPEINQYKIDLEAKKSQFEAKLNELISWLETNNSQLNAFIGNLENIINTAPGNSLRDFDLLTIDIAEDKRQVVVLAEDIVRQAIKLNSEVKSKVEMAIADIDQAKVSSDANKRIELLSKAAQSIFGQDFKIVPKFRLSSQLLGEIDNCITKTDQLLEYQHNELDEAFPVDSWLHGIARVREKMGQWETLTILSESFQPEQDLSLTPVQFPFHPTSPWLALEYPKDFKIDRDHLLYTSYGLAASEYQCGLLVDEWTEVIPEEKETTGISFQYDQPNSEPPQTMLLATPSEFTGQWTWDDLVGAVQSVIKMAKLRAMEPRHLDHSPYAHFLPATISATSKYFAPFVSLNYSNANELINTLEFETNGNE